MTYLILSLQSLSVSPSDILRAYSSYYPRHCAILARVNVTHGLYIMDQDWNDDNNLN